MIGICFCLKFTRRWCQLTGYLSIGFIHIKFEFIAERDIPKIAPLEMVEVEVGWNGENKITASDGKVYQAKKVLIPKPPNKKVSSYPTASSNKINARRDATKQKTVLQQTPIINENALRQLSEPDQVEVKKETKPTLPGLPPQPKVAQRIHTAVEEAENVDVNAHLEKVESVRPTPDLDKPFVHKFFGSQLLFGTRMIIGNLPRKLHTMEILGKRMIIDNQQYPINEGDLENLKRTIREARA